MKRLTKEELREMDEEYQKDLKKVEAKWAKRKGRCVGCGCINENCPKITSPRHGACPWHGGGMEPECFYQDAPCDYECKGISCVKAEIMKKKGARSIWLLTPKELDAYDRKNLKEIKTIERQAKKCMNS